MVRRGGELVKQPAHRRVYFSKVWKSGSHLFRGLNERRIGEFVPAIPDQRLHAFRRGFEMELEGDDTVVVDESLIAVRRARSKVDSAGGDLEGIAGKGVTNM